MTAAHFHADLRGVASSLQRGAQALVAVGWFSDSRSTRSSQWAPSRATSWDCCQPRALRAAMASAATSCCDRGVPHVALFRGRAARKPAGADR